MEYITTKELARQWGIGQRRLQILLKEGRIEGAKLVGKTWIIPQNVQKPADARKKGISKEIVGEE